MAKKSDGKASIGGRKHPVRRLDESGRAVAEAIHVIGEGDEVADWGRDLLVPLITDGVVERRYLGPEGVMLAREHHASAMAELPDQAFRLGRGDPVLPTVFV